MKLIGKTWFLAMKALAAWIAASALASIVLAQGLNTTTVQGTVYLANGVAGSGTLQLSWPAFTTAANQAVAAGRITAAIGADGFVSVNLAPNLGASPAGLFYTAVYNMTDGTTSTEFWVVPAAAQATIAQVRAQVMPAAQAVQAVNKAYVDQAVQSISQSSLSPSGGTLSGPLYLSGDPTQTMEAADKHYVDSTFGQAVPLTGASLTGPLTSVQLGAAYQVDQFTGSDFGAKLQACLGAVSAVNGGTCDARNFTGTQSMASSLAISTANTTVLLPCATIATSSQLMVTAGTRNVSLRGCALRGASAASGNEGGTVFLYGGSGAMFQVGNPSYASDTLGFHLDDVVVNTTSADNSTAQGLIAYRAQELDLQSLYFLGNSNQTGMTLDGTGNYTGGTFYDNAFNGFGTAVNAIGHQAANPAATDWVNASTFVRLHIDCPTSNGMPIAGTYGINLQQGDGNTFAGGDVEGCSTAMHLGSNAQNNTIIGLRNENSGSQVVADSGSSYNNWITGGTMFTGKLTDNGTRNSFLDAFHRSFNGIAGDWYGSQQDATVTNHYRLGIGNGNERGLYNRYQTDAGYRWTMGLSDATAGEQFYQVLDELNNVYRLAIGQYNGGQSSTNNQTVVNAAGSGAVVLNGSNNSGTGGVVFGSGGPNEATVATINNAGSAQFNGSLQVGGPSTFIGSTSVRNQADGEIDAFLWAGATANQKESFTYKDFTGSSQWYMVKDSSNNWALNSAPGGLDSFKAYQSTNSGDTYVDASNSSGVVRVNYENGSGTQFKVYGGNSSIPYASFTGATTIQFPGLAASSGHNCLQVDNSGYLSNTGSGCGSGANGTVNSGSQGQIAYYSGSGTALSGMTTIPVSAGGTGANTAATALASLGGASLVSTSTQTFAAPISFSAQDSANATLANLGDQPAIPGVSTDGANGVSVQGSVKANTTVSAITDKGGQVYNVMAYGAVPDAQSVNDGQMTAGSNVLYSPSGLFNCSTDIGKVISVQGAGPSGSQLTTTISGCNDSQHVILAVAAASNTVAGAVDTNGVTPTNLGSSGYVGGQYTTTTSGSGSGAILSFLTVNGQIENPNPTPSVPPIVSNGSGYAVGDKIYPAVPGADGSAYFTVTKVDGAGVIWGTDNYSAFNSALSAAAGKHLLIPTAKFLINTAQGTRTLSVPSNTIIEMDKSGTLYWVGVQNGAESANLWSLFSTPNNAANIVFRGLHCVGENLVGQSPVEDNPGCIVLGGNNSHILIENGLFSNSFGHQIVSNADTGFDIQIVRNSFSQDNDTAVNFSGTQTSVSDNHFVNDPGVELAGAESHYDRNIFINPDGQGTLAAGGLTSAANAYPAGTVIGNVIINPRSVTVIGLVDGFNNGIVANNVVQNYVAVAGGTEGFCIGIEYGAYNPVNNNLVANNTCTGTGKGTVFIEGPSTGTTNAVTGTVLRGNVENGTPVNGLIAYSATGVDSSGNTWNGSVADVYLSQAGSNPPSNGTFKDKLVHNTVQLANGSSLKGDTQWSTGTQTNFQGPVQSTNFIGPVNGVSCTGTPSPGQVCTATSATTATWQTGASGGQQNSVPLYGSGFVGAVFPNANASGFENQDDPAIACSGPQTASMIAAASTHGPGLEQISNPAGGDCAGFTGQFGVMYAARSPQQNFGFEFNTANDYNATYTKVMHAGMFATCSSATMLADNVTSSSTCDFVGIRFVPGTDTYLQCVAQSSSGGVTESSIGTVMPTTATELVAQVSLSPSGVTCTVNGSSVTVTSNLPASTKSMTDIFANQAQPGQQVAFIFYGLHDISKNGSY